ncbi:MAG: hypothetical protein ABR912_15745 [Terracidiphilus sp.]
MKRPFGVTFSAILLLLGSLLQLLMAFLMALSGALSGKIPSSGLPGAPAPPPMPNWMPAVMYVLCAFFVALAAWGILTSVGLFRLRRWARYSVLIIGGGLALIGLVSLLSTLMMLAVPPPMPASVDAYQAPMVQTMTKFIFAIVAFLYGIVCAVGISWLVYFNLKRVREVFAGAPGEAAESRRPLLISVLAVLSMIGAGCCLLAAFIPFPAAILGWILYGWGKVALYLVFAGVEAAVGIGLWRLEEWGRRLALGAMALGLANSVVYLARPSLMLQYSAEVNRLIDPMQSPLPAQSQTILYSSSLGFGVLLSIAILAVLIYCRGAFKRPVEPPRNEATALP